VADVDNMQILFGEDTDGDLVANNYIAPGSVTNMANVVSIRIGLMFTTASDVAKSFMEPTRTYDMLGDGNVMAGPWSDRRQRRVVISTYNLRNRTP